MNLRRIVRGLAGVLVIAGICHLLYRFETATLDAQQTALDAQEATATPPSPGTPSKTADPPSTDEPIAHALNQRGTWEFQKMPLATLVKALRDSMHIDILINVQSLEDAGIPTDVMIDCRLEGVSLGAFLGVALRQIGLTHAMYAGALWITTPEDAELHGSVRMYPIHDLIRDHDAWKSGSYDCDELISVIWRHLAPDSWSQTGESGAIEGIYGSLVVSHRGDVQEQVSEFLTALRELRRHFKENPQAILAPIFVRDSAAHASILMGLEHPVSFDVTDAPLFEVVASLAKLTDIPIVLDTRGFGDFGLATDLRVSANVKHLPLRIALRRLLAPHDLTWTVRDEVLSITTWEASEENWLPCIYPVNDLVAPYPGAPIDEWDFDRLRELLPAIVAPDTWDEATGSGPIDSLVYPPVLVISQTEAVHEQLRDVMQQLRRAKQLEHVAHRDQHDKPDRLTIRAYAMNPGQDAKHVLPVLIRFLGDDILEGERVLLEILGNQLVVRHNSQGHRRIRQFLFELSYPGFPQYGGASLGERRNSNPEIPGRGKPGGGGFF